MPPLNSLTNPAPEKPPSVPDWELVPFKWEPIPMSNTAWWLIGGWPLD